jgi:hypothetical protein
MYQIVINSWADILDDPGHCSTALVNPDCPSDRHVGSHRDKASPFVSVSPPLKLNPTQSSVGFAIRSTRSSSK